MTAPTTATNMIPTPAPEIADYHHLGLTVRDVEVSEAWYSRVLGLTRAFVEPHGVGMGYHGVCGRAHAAGHRALLGPGPSHRCRSRDVQ
jgi:catechol 2,3-dioxygenase-like lactoylglutathione lyase family enzyme